MPQSIYQKLWDTDMENNGFSVSGKDQQGNWVNHNADVLLNLQATTNNARRDAATEPLFHFVNESKINAKSIQEFIRLLNNYIFLVTRKKTDDDHLREDPLGFNPEEDQEIDTFINTIVESEVGKLTFNYITTELNNAISVADFKKSILKVWFEIFTNYFNNNAVHDCSGFEHVFVGEQDSSRNREVGGFHNWIKFYLDEKHQRADFKGLILDTKRFNLQDANAYPFVVTLAMEIEPLDMNGNRREVFRKDKGGFFVGLSPEAEICIGMIAFYEDESGKFAASPNGTNKKIVLNNVLYDLVLYRSTDKNQSRGQHIRSLYPVILKPSTDGDDNVSEEPATKNLKIVSALVNPDGEDKGKEWVIIRNLSNKIVNIDGYKLVDKLNNVEKISGSVMPNKELKVVIKGEQGMQLTNKNGAIKLLSANNEVIHAVTYKDGKKGEVLNF